jgi:glutamate racemase
MRIGIFDSGFGGLTVHRSIRGLLPHYDYVYLGDNARTPYGNRSFETILKFTLEGIECLFESDCRLVVIACNTASAKALRTLQQRYLPHHRPDRRVLGIIRPSAEALAAGLGETARTVAVWGTEGTVRSQSYVLELNKLAPTLRLVQVACPLLVPLVEAGEIEGEGVDYFIRRYWQSTLSHAHDVTALLLACTHYPLLLPRIRALVPPQVSLLVQGDIVAPSLADYLARHPEIETELTRGGSEKLLTTDRTEGFDSLAERFLGRTVASERVELKPVPWSLA